MTRHPTNRMSNPTTFQRKASLPSYSHTRNASLPSNLGRSRRMGIIFHQSPPTLRPADHTSQLCNKSPPPQNPTLLEDQEAQSIPYSLNRNIPLIYVSDQEGNLSSPCSLYDSDGVTDEEEKEEEAQTLNSFVTFYTHPTTAISPFPMPQGPSSSSAKRIVPSKTLIRSCQAGHLEQVSAKITSMPWSEQAKAPTTNPEDVKTGFFALKHLHTEKYLGVYTEEGSLDGRLVAMSKLYFNDTDFPTMSMVFQLDESHFLDNKAQLLVANTAEKGKFTCPQYTNDGTQLSTHECKFDRSDGQLQQWIVKAADQTNTHVNIIPNNLRTCLTVASKNGTLGLWDCNQYESLWDLRAFWLAFLQKSSKGSALAPKEIFSKCKVLRIREQQDQGQQQYTKEEEEEDNEQMIRSSTSSPPPSHPEPSGSSPPIRPAHPAPALQKLPQSKPLVASSSTSASFPHLPSAFSAFRLGKPSVFGLKGRYGQRRVMTTPSLSKSSSSPSLYSGGTILHGEGQTQQDTTFSISSPTPVVAKSSPMGPVTPKTEVRSSSPGINSRSAGARASPMILATASAFHPRYGHTSLEREEGIPGRKRGKHLQSPSHVQSLQAPKSSPALRKLKDLTPPEMNYVISALDMVLARNSGGEAEENHEDDLPILDHRWSRQHQEDGFTVPSAPSPADKDLDDIIMAYEWSGVEEEEEEEDDNDLASDKYTRTINLQEARKRLRAAGSFSRVLSRSFGTVQCKVGPRHGS
ncbi:MAG: hypothetical protein DHS80DRAFT_29119 [Piptocephalis tieghemiana]|nr:MAG: hypothetical protein DHS80DRAFT_29119 [Piptocephalis tieghemiana]